jgi:hypothetical protein
MKNLFSLICLSIFLTCFGSVNLKAQTADTNAKKIRIALMAVKPVSVGEGMDAQQFASAIQNSLGEYLKSPEIEIVLIEAKLPSAIESEIKEKPSIIWFTRRFRTKKAAAVSEKCSGRSLRCSDRSHRWLE